IPAPPHGARIPRGGSARAAGAGSTALKRASIRCRAPHVMAAPASSSASDAIASADQEAIRTGAGFRAPRTSCAICPAAWVTEASEMSKATRIALLGTVLLALFVGGVGVYVGRVLSRRPPGVPAELVPPNWAEFRASAGHEKHLAQPNVVCKDCHDFEAN